CESFPLLSLSPLYLLGRESLLLKQTDVSVTRGQTKTAWIDCVGEGISDFKTAYIHWYRQIPPKAPERVLYIGSGQSPVFDNSGDERRFQVRKHPTELRYDLTIDYLTPRDSGIYYCDKPYKKGTLFSEPQALNSAKNSDTSLFHPSRHENQIMYVCLIEKFYPEVIRVTWTDGADKEVTDNIVKGDVWKPTNGDKYSIGSWLTVPAENKDKNYYCKYEHENQQRSLSTQGIYYMLKI
uniref:Ig-like domain-containing protein n=1 Tax=Bubo bubo TaxID=30461 RepID=A0A8C0FEW6_BUBBB